MPIAHDSIVSMHYRLTINGDQEVDSSAGGEPLSFRHGAGEIIPGLEQALTGRDAGDNLQIDIAADEAYGERDESLMIRIPKEAFNEEDQAQIRPGVRFQGPHPHDQEQGAVYTVLAEDEQGIVADANHPLAGQQLHFEIDIVSVQDGAETDD